MAFEIPKRLPLLVQPGNRDETTSKDAKLVNCFAEKDGNSDTYWIQKRLGFSAPVYTFLGGGGASGVGEGMYLWSISGTKQVIEILPPVGFPPTPPSSITVTLPFGDQLLFAMSGTTLYYVKYVAGVKTSAALTNPYDVIVPNNKFRFYPIPVVRVGVIDLPGLVIGNGSQTYVISWDTGSQTAAYCAQLKAGVNNFPVGVVDGFVNMNGFNYVMDTSGVIWGSVFQSVVVWDTLNKIVAQIDTDGGVMLARQLTYIVAFKQRTTEFFVDEGNPTGSPLTPVEGAVLRFGCAAADSVQELDDSLYWIATNQSGLFQIGRLQNLQFSVVSTPRIDRLLQSNLGGSCLSFAFRQGGHSYYVLTLLSAQLTLVYDVGQDLWYEWGGASGEAWNIVDHATDLDGKKLLQSGTGGFIYNADGDYVYPTDNGTIVPVDIYTPNFDAAIDRRKMLSMMQLDADQVPGSRLALRVSDDDYQTWTDLRYFDLNQIRPTLTDCGTFYKRAFHFRHECATSFRIKAVNLQMGIGTL